VSPQPHGKLPNAQSAIVKLIVLCLTAIAWEAGGRLADTPFFPPITTIASTIASEWFGGPGYQLFLSDSLIEIVWPSMTRLVPGLAFGLLLGIGAGTLFGLVRPVGDMFEPHIHFLRAIPSAVKVPLFMAVLGIGQDMKISLIAVSTALPLLLNTFDGVRTVDPMLLDTARLYRLSPWQRLACVILPSAAPKIFAGIKVSAGVAMVVLVLVEFVASADGIGHYILESQRRFRLLDMWAGVVLLAVLGYCFFGLLELVERRVLTWHRGARGATG
jgi:ABC-type nitrate/sulfonate/bicarbonate transport system permease component